jgi:hypothetical protein
MTNLIQNNPICGNAIFNSTLPILLAEFEENRIASAMCGAILDAISGEENVLQLVSAVADTKRRYDDVSSRLKTKIARAADDSLSEADRQAFLKLDGSTQSELAPLIVDDPILVEAMRIIAAKRNASQTPSNYGDTVQTVNYQQNHASETHHPLGSIYQMVADKIQEVANFVDTCPEIASDKATEFNRQLTTIIESVDALGAANQKMNYAQEILDWKLQKAVGCNQSVPTCNSGEIRAFDSFNALCENNGMSMQSVFSG